MAKKKHRRKKKVHCVHGKLKHPRGRRICRKKKPGRRSRR